MRFPRMTRKRVALLTLAVGALVLVGVAWAPPIPGPLYRGPLTHRINAHADGVNLNTHGAIDLAQQDITYPPNTNSGWHIHPGVVLVVQAGPGTLTFHHGCEVHTVAPNHSFYESGDTPVLAENLSAQDVVVHAMVILPTGSPPRINVDPPSC